ncbi:MAG: oligosaccharide flippase family protein [Lachnospiraceae bacterium]|nr:oligosaccharide flippase family protein [Lachnospiraceae bacterium]
MRKRKGSLIRQAGLKAVWEWPILLIELLYLTLLTHKVGCGAIAYLAGPMLIYLLLRTVCGNCMEEIVRRRVRFFRGRDALLSANKVYHIILFFTLSVVAAISVIFCLFADELSLFLFQTTLCSLNLRILGPVLFLEVILYGMGGYLDGMGFSFSSVINKILSPLIGCVVLFFISGPVFSYAGKVSDLMRSQEYYYAYISTLGALGILAGDLVTFLVMLLLRASMMKQIHRVYDGGLRKNKQSVTDVILGYLGSLNAVAWEGSFLYVMLLALLIIPRAKEAPVSVEYQGMIFLIAMWVFVPISMLARHICMSMDKQVQRDFKLGDMRSIRDRIALCMKTFVYLVFPYLTMLFTMAPSVTEALFDDTKPEFVSGLRMGVWCILILGLALFLWGVLSLGYTRTKTNLLLVLGIVCAVGGSFFAGKQPDALPQNGILSGILIGALIMLLIETVMVWRTYHFKEDLLRIFVLTAVCSVLLGLITFVLQKVVYQSLGCWVVLGLGIPCGVLIYITGIVMTHTFDSHELMQVPGKALPVSIARWLKLY